MVKSKRKALLIGVSEYGEGIPPLEIVPNDIEILQQAFEQSGFTVEPLLSSVGKGVTKAAIRKAISKVCKSAESLDALAIYFSGHGIHYQNEGKDYLVTGDASYEDLRDPDLCEDYLFAPDELNRLLGVSQVSTIFVIVDACREGVNLDWEEDTKGIVLAGWGVENQWRSSQSTVYLFACEKGQRSQYIRSNGNESGFSLFTKALAEAIHPDCPASTIQEVLEEAQTKLNNLIIQFNQGELDRGKHKQPQKIRCIPPEHGANENPLSKVICEGRPGGVVREESNPWVETILRSQLWPDKAESDGFNELKEHVRKIVQRCWQEWDAAVKAFPDDPWRDPQLPAREVEALELLTLCSMPRIEMTLAEVAVALVIPFLREAILASGMIEASKVYPLALATEHPKSDLRRALEKTHQLLPRFVRRVERLEQTGKQDDQNAVMVWMLHRCLLRSLEVWQPQTEGGYLSDELLEFLQPSANSLKLIRDTFNSERLIELSKSIFADLDRLDSSERVKVLQLKVIVGSYSQEQELREQLLAYLLNLSGWLAIDIRTLSDVVVDHIGLTNPIYPQDVLKTVSEASWRPFSLGRALEAKCQHPAIDLALKTHVEQANSVLSKILEKSSEQVGLDALKGLPPYLKSDRVKPESRNGRSIYRTPHTNFQLAHDEIRELLMGEQLYGDPTLAVRELYQNALDACRYREARLKYLRQTNQYGDLNWQGRIVFRQGYEDGRPYIECEDNGIGMGMLHLSQCFAKAGRRFTELPEFIEERADWLKLDPPVQLYPNSQFGIGVLSYFMLADEIQVETCRLKQSGFPGEESLLVLIPGSSGLFQIREGSRIDSGTKVRLYLNRTEYGNEQISCLEVLRELLWVAEFNTQVQMYDHKNQLVEEYTWVPEQLHSPALLKDEYENAGHPDLWWLANPNQGRVLADGLLTNQKSLVIVNLRRQQYPALTVDRKDITAWDEDWFLELLTQQSVLTSLKNWSNLDFKVLWQLLESIPNHTANAMLDFLIQEDVQLGLEKNKFRKGSKISIPLKEVGCSGVDERALRGILEDILVLNYRIFDLGRTSVPGILYPKYLGYREKLWGNLLRRQILSNKENDFPFRWHSKLWPLLRPGDSLILLLEDDSSIFLLEDKPSLIGSLRGRANWLEEVPFGHLLRASVKLKRPVQEIVQRLQQFTLLGLKLPHLDVQNLASLDIDNEDLLVLSKDLNGQEPWLEDISSIHLLIASVKLKRPVQEIVQRLQQFTPLGLKLPHLNVQNLASLDVDEEDIVLLSSNLNGQGPWLEEVSFQDLLGTSTQLRRPIKEVVHRLQKFAPLGLKLPELNAQQISLLHNDKEDLLILSMDLDGQPPWLKDVVSLRHLLQASAKTNIPIKEIFQRLQKFVCLGLQLPEIDWQVFNNLEVTADDFLMLSKYLDGDMPLLQGDVSRLHIARASDLRNEPISVTFDRLKLFAPKLDLILPDDDPEHWDLDSLFQP